MWNREPAAFAALLQAAFVAAVSFGLDVTAEQVGALVALSTAALTVFVRQSVTPIRAGAAGATAALTIAPTDQAAATA